MKTMTLALAATAAAVLAAAVSTKVSAGNLPPGYSPYVDINTFYSI